MNIDSLKLELIQWILFLQDVRVLTNIQKIKDKNFSSQPEKESGRIEPISTGSLLACLSTLEDILEPFPDVDEGLLPLDDIVI